MIGGGYHVIRALSPYSIDLLVYQGNADYYVFHMYNVQSLKHYHLPSQE